MDNNTAIDLQIDEQTALGIYSNLAIISHSTSEFIIDFATILPGVNKATVRTRVVMTPEHTKRLLLSLQENVARYEANVAPINIATTPPETDDTPNVVN